MFFCNGICKEYTIMLLRRYVQKNQVQNCRWRKRSFITIDRKLCWYRFTYWRTIKSNKMVQIRTKWNWQQNNNSKCGIGEEAPINKLLLTRWNHVLILFFANLVLITTLHLYNRNNPLICTYALDLTTTEWLSYEIRWMEQFSKKRKTVAMSVEEEPHE